MPEGVSDYAIGGVAARSYGTSAPMQGSGNKGVLKGAFKRVFGTSNTDGSSREELEVGAADMEEIFGAEDDNIYVSVSIDPAFDDSGMELEDFLKHHMQFPWAAKVQGTEGEVFVQFVVEKDGSISDIKVISGLGDGCNEEAIRLIELTDGLWEPGILDGDIVRTRMTVPVHFKI
jgi:TonB family protein